MTAVFLFVLAAFAVFCRYYPWQVPAPADSAAGATFAVIKAESN